MFSLPPIPTALLAILALFILITEVGRRRSQLRAPRITQVELDTLRARLAKANLPIARVKLSNDGPSGAATSRIGGPAYVDSLRRRWPVRGKDRRPMLLLAQINFAEVPALADFPSKGLLQLFGCVDERGHLESLENKADRVIRWFPDPDGNLTLTPPGPLSAFPKRYSMSPRVVEKGMGMSFERNDAEANPANWPYDETLAGFDRRLPETDDVKRSLRALQQEAYGTEKDQGFHWVGGHPRFVQGDVRFEPRLRKLNRVLLHLTDDNSDIRLGDSGELNLMISSKALRNADFDQAYCTWDCS